MNTATFKCLTNAQDPTPTRQPPAIKQKFAKLTLSSNKKLPPIAPDVDQPPVDDKPLTPTPKMLTFEPELTDDEDEAVPAVANNENDKENNSSIYDQPTLPDPKLAYVSVAQQRSSLVNLAQQRSSLVNKLLISDPSPCEGPSFSQQLLLNDTDVTNCTELNHQRRSSIRPSWTAAPAAVEAVAEPVHPAAAPLQPPPNEAYNQTLSQMERLELTASSEDLFGGSGGGDSRDCSHQEPAAADLAEAIGNLSVRDEVHLASSQAAAPKVTPRVRHTVFTISSSSSSSAASEPPSPRPAAEPQLPQPARQLSTRSSLASEDVYDVITLSDSQTEDGADSVAEEEEAVDVPIADNTADRLCNMSSPGASEPQVLPSAVAADVLSLPSSVQNRLDRFFDNIPMLSGGSEEAAGSPAIEDSILSSSSSSSLLAPPVEVVAPDAEAQKSAASSRNTSVYVSETDEDADDADASLDLPSSNALQMGIESVAESAVPASAVETPVVSQNIVPSQPITVSHSTTSSAKGTPASVRRADKTSGSRTPTVNIEAKFQIRIQVNHNESTSTESSSSSSSAPSEGPNASQASSTDCQVVSPAPRSVAASSNVVSVNEQADKIAELHIAEPQQRKLPEIATPTPTSTSKTNLATNTGRTETPVSRAKTATTPRTVDKRLQLDRLRTPKSGGKVPPPAAASAVIEAAVVDDAVGCQPIEPPPVAPRTPDKPKIVLDDEAQKLLNELYGTSWQTPDLLRKCVIRRPGSATAQAPATAVKAQKTQRTLAASANVSSAGKAVRTQSRTNPQQLLQQQQKTRVMAEQSGAGNETRLSQDFSLFRKNIASHLDSTRIGEVQAKIQRTPKPNQPTVAETSIGSPFFKKPPAVCARTEQPKTPKPTVTVTADPTPKAYKPRRSSMDGIKSAKKKVPNRIVDSSSSEEESDDDDHVETPVAVPSVQPQNPSQTPATTGRSVRNCRLNGTKITKTAQPHPASSDSDSAPDKENLANLISSDDSADDGDEWQAPAPAKPRSKAASSTTSSATSATNTSASSTSSRGSRRSATNKNDLTYLDLTHAEVVEDECHERPDASDTDLEAISKRLLADFEFAAPKAFAHTPARSADMMPPPPPAAAPVTATKTKRKLYNPAFEDLEHARREIYSPLADITRASDVNLARRAAAEEDELLIDDPSMRVQLRGQVPLPKILQNPRLGDLQAAAAATPSPKTPTAKTPKSTRKTPAIAVAGLTLADICRPSPHGAGQLSFLASLDVHVALHRMHPAAVAFRDRFRANREKLTALLLELYVERIFDGQLAVPVVWNRKLQKTAGLCCNRRRAGERTASIELSDKVCTSADRLRCTLVHELCHAATWVFQGDSGHGATWKRWAAKANALLPELPQIERCHNYEIEYKYLYQCVLCGAKSPAQSKSKKVERIRCAFCHGAIEIYLNKKNAAGEVCPQPVRKATGFAAFVKAEYKGCKQESGVAHAEVMRLLSAKYARLTVEEKKRY